MSLRIARSALTVLAATGTLLFAARSAPAQCQGGGQQSGTSQSSTSQTNAVPRQGRTALQRQQTGLQNILRQQQTGLQLQAALQQQTALQNVALQQQQQLALQNFLMQQQAGSLSSRQQPSQDTSQATRLQRQPQGPRVAFAQPQPIAAPDSTDKIQPVENPEETAARQVRVARALAADAETARQEGKGELAATLRARAEERLQRVLDRYAGTEAADAAERVLQKLR